MAIYTGTKTETTELQEILQEIYAESFTLRDNLVEIDQGHKTNADVYESSVTVTPSALSNDAVTATGDINMNANKTTVPLHRFQYEDVIDHEQLRGTRFERSIAKGSFGYVSDEYDQKVLIQVAPAIGESIENYLWNGALSATKTAIAGLTAGAGQGSISAGAQTLVSNMPTSFFDSIPTVILYNNSQAKATPGAGLGDYIKVPSIAGSVTASNIASEYEKAYLIAPSKILNKLDERPVIFAPLADRQLIKVANNAVSATADNKNFLIEGSGASEKISYNGIEIKFVPLVGFRILALPSYIKILMDLASDVSMIEIDKMSNGERRRYIKSWQTMATWVVGQKYITLYGG